MVCPRAFNQRVVLREHIRSHHSAPDPVHGTTLTPYYCSLCGELFAVSLDLIHHLIEHSDRSTAAKRVQPTGPRKYKRRRKLNDDEMLPIDGKYPRIPQSKIKQEPADIDSNSESNSSSNNHSVFKGLLTQSFESYVVPNSITEFKLPDEIFQTVSRDRKNDEKKQQQQQVQTSSRPKMIFTEKTRVPVYDGKRKTRTMIQKQVLKQHPTTSRMVRTIKKEVKNKPSIIQERYAYDDKNSSGSETCSNEDDPNEDVLRTLLKRERKLSEKFTIDLVNDLQDILRSPIKTNIHIDEDDEQHNSTDVPKARRRNTVTRYSISMTNNNANGAKNDKNYYDNDNDDSESELENVVIKQEYVNDGHVCNICGSSFSSRDQLLEHVSIHI